MALPVALLLMPPQPWHPHNQFLSNSHNEYNKYLSPDPSPIIGEGYMKYISVFNARKMINRRRSLRNKQTENEKILWQELRTKKLGVKFKRQYSLGNYVVDFYCPSSKLAIELMGSVHNTTEAR